MSPHQGIAGLQGREPIGAVIAIGKKSDRGFPIEKDRFHVLWPQENAEGVRPPHPQFRDYNQADPKFRQLVIGQIVHATAAECFEYSYRAQAAKGQPSHPSKVPFCTGNGDKAKRYVGKRNGDHAFDTIACPADRCEFRQGDKAPCKPWMRFLFRAMISEKLPTPLCKYTSGSWNTIRNLVGFFDLIEKQSKAVGLVNPSLMGLKFTLQLTEQTNVEKKSRFPVVRIVPLDDPITFFSAQLDRVERARALGLNGQPEQRQIAEQRAPIRVEQARPVAALTDREESNPDTESADYRNHTPGVATSARDDDSEETP